MILTEKFKETNPEKNVELKKLYWEMIFVEKQRELDWTTYVFADSIEAKAEYVANKETYAEMVFDKFYNIAY
jgi:hypothetical protein